MNYFEELKDIVISKLEGECDLSWDDICDKFELNLNPHELRKRSYGIKAYDDFLKEKNIEQSSNDIKEEINEKLIELKKERAKLTDLRTQVNKDIREQARYESLLDLLEDEINKLSFSKPLFVATPKSIPVEDKIKTVSLYKHFNPDNTFERKECVMLLSDLHYGIEINNNWNKFNSDIARSRMAHMVNKTIEYGKLHKCKMCHVLITGDLVNNNIHLTSRLSNRESIAMQTVGVSELISECITKLCNEFSYVTLSLCDGNHDRIYPNKSDNDYNDSFIHIIKEFIKLRCSSLKNFILNENKHGHEIVNLNVCGKNIVGLHGDKIPAKSTIPRLTTMFGKVDYVVRGHVHNSSQDSFGSSKLITVSSFSGMDEYAKHLGLNSKPSQKILILSAANDDECIYDIDLSKVGI